MLAFRVKLGRHNPRSTLRKSAEPKDSATCSYIEHRIARLDIFIKALDAEPCRLVSSRPKCRAGLHFDKLDSAVCNLLCIFFGNQFPRWLNQNIANQQRLVEFLPIISPVFLAAFANLNCACSDVDKFCDLS